MVKKTQLALWLSSLVLTMWSLDVQQSSPRLALTREEIAAAIEWGRTARPASYALRNNAGVRVGAVYTPYLRVALASRAAAESNQDFGPKDVTPRLIDPRGPGPTGEALVYIAMRVDGIDSAAHPEASPEVRLLRDTFDGASAASVTTAAGGTVGLGRRIAPVYMQFGLELEAVYSVASFHREQLQAGMQVELFDRAHGQRWKESTRGIITASDLSHWR